MDLKNSKKNIASSKDEIKEKSDTKKISNPINSPKIMPIGMKSSSNRLFSGYAANLNKPFEVNYPEILSSINTLTVNQTDPVHFYYDLHNKLCAKISLNFTALGLVNNFSRYVNVKLIDKTGTSYNSNVMLNDSDNILVKAFQNRQHVLTPNSEYLKLNYLKSSQTHIIPLITFDECIGVMLFSDNTGNQYYDLYQLITNYFAMFYRNSCLTELVKNNTDTDLLTGLFNHKKLQEELALEISNCANSDRELAFCIIDIANISEINSELGHAKGDQVIQEVAKKIKKNVRNTDVLGRYGGDEIAIVMPDTSIEDAKYVCEFLLYNLSCTMFDDLGQLKFSCGISMFPKTTNKQEKLTILAEQALCIAKSKRNKSGQSEIVSTNDYSFWDDEALKSYAQVLSKKHATIGINIEDELLTQFHNEKITSNDHLLEIVSSLANAIDAKDTYTKGHSAAVSRYSEALARAINLPSNEVERIKLGAMLHDIGKIGIPEDVLRKPTRLSDDEWQVMKQHPSIGADKVLKPNQSLHDLIPMVKYHHEHIDGSGYPYGLKGEDIPLSAKIVAVADAYHALISDRPYRKGLSVKKACEILKMGAGTQWDRELVRQFIIIAPSLATNI